MPQDRTLERIAAMESLMRGRDYLAALEQNLESAKSEAARFRTAGLWLIENRESVPSGILGALGDALAFNGSVADALVTVLEVELPIARKIVQERENEVAFLDDGE